MLDKKQLPVFLLLVLCTALCAGYPRSAAASPRSGPVISPITTNLVDYPNGRVPRYQMFDLSFTLSVTYSNPFDPAQIQVDGTFTAPDNTTAVQPGFYYQGYTVTVAGGNETYTPVGNATWKVRFSPQQVGAYQYSITVKDGSGATSSNTASFEVVDTGDPGFIRVSNTNSRYFAFESGRPYIGVGLNVAWWQDDHRRLSTYQYYLDRMHDYGANLARVWMTNSGKDQSWILSIQDKTLGADYNLEKAWTFDRILDRARQDGVYLLLTLDDVNQYTYNWPTNLYSTSLSGPCAQPSCVFTSATAREYQKRVFRYLVARWGYSTHILSWELFNEISELEWSTANWDWCQVVGWHQEMAQYIQSIDAQRHMVNSSTGSFKTYGGVCGGAGSSPNLYALPDMAFAQIHFYYVQGCCGYAASDPAGQDMANLTRYYAHLVYNSISDKPALVGEWGLLNSNWVDSPYLATDITGVHLHNGLWSSVMSGMAATGLNWHWAYHQVHDPSWWQHYRGIANYLADIDVANLAVMKPLNVDFTLPGGSDGRPDAFASTNGTLRAMGLKSGNTVYAWVQNTQNTWWNVVHQITPTQQTGTLTIYDLTPGMSFTVSTWDTYMGQIVRTDIITAQLDGSIQVPVRNLTSDLALQVHPTMPTAVNLLSFHADNVTGKQVTLAWATAQELGTIGYNLYRSDTPARNHAILVHYEPTASPGGVVGVEYRYTDTVPASGAWWYWLEGVSGVQTASVVAAISVVVRSDTYLPIVAR